MSRRIEQILELFQEQLEVEGYDADDIERVRASMADAKPEGSLECLIHMQHFMRRLHITRPVLEETA
ncbi:hypothetical protein [Pseudomonas sp. FP2309]|uniref:hypothetical protein n=1 Tax=Pseudomonas sp. FP2309 TaxID=2954091 RepID=UPI0027353713|nr:hypothetical protein [Pseudomonas sp. FP2309]WLH67233.1 hypothetical protein PSH59_19190 [Pseudomonas sp. FP2309]